MSQKNVTGILRRKSDGALFETLYTSPKEALIAGMKFMRIGPVGAPRHKRRWEAIDVLLRDYEPTPSADAVARGPEASKG